jgi:hypothetical protein
VPALSTTANTMTKKVKINLSKNIMEEYAFLKKSLPEHKARLTAIVYLLKASND